MTERLLNRMTPLCSVEVMPRKTGNEPLRLMT